MKRIVQILVFFNVALYCSYAYLYFYNKGMTSFKPLYWLFFTIVTALCLMLLLRSGRLLELPRSIIVWLLVYLSYNIICFLYSSQSEDARQALIEAIKLCALFFSLLIIFQSKQAIRISRTALLLVVLFSVAMNLIDFIIPTWSKIHGRAAGLYANPTIAGKVMVMAMVLSVPLVTQRLRLVYCAFVGLGVLVTFSRGPWLFWFVAVIGLASIRYIDVGRKSTSIIVTASLAGIVVYSALTGGLLGFVSDAGLDKYLTQDTYTRLGGEGAAFSDSSTESRVAAAEKAWSTFGDYPWTGAGLGYDRESRNFSHNTYLVEASEGGVIKLGIFVSLLIVLWFITDNIGRITLIVYALSSFTSLDNLRQPALIVFLCLIAVIAKERYWAENQYNVKRL